MDRLRSFRFSERLTSGRGGITTAYEVQAPDRLSLRLHGGFRSVIIGRTRWDYHDGSWERGPFPGLTLSRCSCGTGRARPHRRPCEREGVTELAAFGL